METSKCLHARGYSSPMAFGMGEFADVFAPAQSPYRQCLDRKGVFGELERDPVFCSASRIERCSWSRICRRFANIS